jgi:hypothetical protein
MTPSSKPLRIVFLVLHTRPVPGGPLCNYFRDTTGRFWSYKWVIASLRIKFKAEHQQLNNDNAVMFISMDFRFSLLLFRDVAPCNLVETDRPLRRSHRLGHQGAEDGGGKHL